MLLTRTTDGDIADVTKFALKATAMAVDAARDAASGMAASAATASTSGAVRDAVAGAAARASGAVVDAAMAVRDICLRR